mgnify:CR=1 FL=1
MRSWKRLDGPGTQTVEVENGRERTVYFAVRTGDGPGDARFTITASGNGERTRSQTGVPVRVRCSVSVGESEPQFVEFGGYLVGGAFEDAGQGGRVGQRLPDALGSRARGNEGFEEEREWGFGSEDYVWLDEHQARQRVALRDCRGAVFTPHCARIHPAKLVRGLARTVESLGATIYERTAVERIEPGRAVTAAGPVRAPVVVQATEGYSALLPGQRRRLVPLYSLMIATEPLPEEVWAQIGWKGNETLHDGRHLLIYAQRTADGRIALGGRGAPYHFGSRIEPGFERAEVQDALQSILVDLFPATRSARITHRWGGPLGVPRDWFSSVGLERSTGLAWAGGYVGDGVSTTNHAGSRSGAPIAK